MLLNLIATPSDCPNSDKEKKWQRGVQAVGVVIIIGSGPGALQSRDWRRSSSQTIVAINNAWQVRPDWDYLIHPEDFPINRRPRLFKTDQKTICANDYVPLQNQFGGFVYAGGTMAFTAAYWALAALKPRVIAMIGCDMVYPQTGPTHFYGQGTADPLRDDITLRSLEAKSARLLALASQSNCALVNLSNAPTSRLIYPRAVHSSLNSVRPIRFQSSLIERALRAEARANYMVPNGRYWKVADQFDPKVIDKIDQLWLDVAEHMILNNDLSEAI